MPILVTYSHLVLTWQGNPQESDLFISGFLTANKFAD